MDLVNSPSLRRSQRTRTRSTNHLLQIIPELVEDDDSSSLQSRDKSKRRHAIIGNINPNVFNDPFHLTVEFSNVDVSFAFPRPPSPRLGSESPTPSLASSTSFSLSSPLTSALLTPPCSDDDNDDDFLLSPPPPSDRVLIPRRTTIKPLTIVKHSPQPETALPNKNSELIRDSCPCLDDDEYASEWYAREFSDILTPCSPLSPHIASVARPDSIYAPRSFDDASVPCTQLDPSYHPVKPKKLPLPPSSPASLRPLPRISLPADIGFQDEEPDPDPNTNDSDSIYSQDVLGDAIIAFEEACESAASDTDDHAYQLQLPLELPFSPLDLDLETDIAIGMLELERREREAAAPETPGVIIFPDERTLRSKWSASTLRSTEPREDRLAPGMRAAAEKLKGYLYFGAGKKRRGKASVPSSPSHWSTTSPPGRSPNNPYALRASPLNSPLPSPGRWSKELSPPGTMVYVRVKDGDNSGTVRRSRSRESGESAVYRGGDDDGLKRKQIPVDMFLRSS
jgi:hypothetical protein